MANQSQQQLNTVNLGSDHILTALSFLVNMYVCCLSVRVCERVGESYGYKYCTHR